MVRKLRLKPQTFKNIFAKAQKDLLFTQASALAYTTLASLVPLTAVGFFLFKAFGGFKALEDKISPFLADNIAPAFGEEIMGILDGIESKISGGAVGTFGFVGFIVTAVSTLATIEKTFNLIWGTSKHRSWGKRIPIYWSLLTLGPLFFGLSLYTSTLANTWLTNDNGEIAKALLFLMNIASFFLSGVLFALVFKILPNISVRWKQAIRAGFVTGIAFEIAKRGYSLYATRALGQLNVYGSLAILPLFLLWMYAAWIIVLFGAEYCWYLGKQKELDETEHWVVDDKQRRAKVQKIAEQQRQLLDELDRV